MKTGSLYNGIICSLQSVLYDNKNKRDNYILKKILIQDITLRKLNPSVKDYGKSLHYGKNAPQEKFDYPFSGDFYQCWENFLLVRRTEH